jgi:hypothetical protein
MQELYISYFSSGTDTMLPSRLCTSINKVITNRSVVSFESATPILEELRLRETSNRNHHGASMSEIRRVLNANGGNLRILEVTGLVEDVEDTDHIELDTNSLCNLQDITMTMGTLVTLLGLECRLPNLRTLRLLGQIDTTLQAWERFLAVYNLSSTIHAVHFGKLPMDLAAKLDPFIATLKNDDFEVHDNSGEYILVSSTDI